MSKSPKDRMDRFSKDSFQEWINHPLTLIYLQFLMDRRSMLARKWAAGVKMDPESQMNAMFLGELSNLKFEEVEEFYEIQDDQSAS